jgi:hypothetical protein
VGTDTLLGRARTERQMKATNCGSYVQNKFGVKLLQNVVRVLGSVGFDNIMLLYHQRTKYNQARACLLTPWRRVLLQKLTGLQLVKKFPPFYGTRRFLTALTSARQEILYYKLKSNCHSYFVNEQNVNLFL